MNALFKSILPPGEGRSSSWEDAQLAKIAKDHHLLKSFQTLKYINIALLTILLYDYCLTFNLERKRIWTLKWRLPKCLFMFNRYIIPPIFLFLFVNLDILTVESTKKKPSANVMNVGHKICSARVFMPISTSAAILTVELMLVLRVLALYGNSSGLARYLVIQFFVQLITSSLLLGFLLSRTRIIVGRNIFTGCLYDLPNWASLSWAPLFVVESVLVILTIYKCRNYGKFSPTIKILARDSIIYFVSITSIIAFNVIYPRRYPLIGMALALPTSVFTSIAAARLSMNIRAITVERGIATLVHQSHLPTLRFRSHATRNTNDSASAGGIDASSDVKAVESSPTGIPAGQGEKELEGGYYDREDDDGWCDEDEDEDEAIKLEDRSVSIRADDIETAAVDALRISVLH